MSPTSTQTRGALCLRVSTDEQSTELQRRESRTCSPRGAAWRKSGACLASAPAPSAVVPGCSRRSERISTKRFRHIPEFAL